MDIKLTHANIPGAWLVIEMDGTGVWTHDSRETESRFEGWGKDKRDEVVALAKRAGWVQESFTALLVAYQIPGRKPGRKVVRTAKQLEALVEKLAEQGGETLAFSTDIDE